MGFPGQRAPAAARLRSQVRTVWLPAARLALGTASALGLARFAYGLLLPAMRSQLGWSLAQAGALTTANALGYLVGALVAAAAARRFGEAAIFRVGMVLTVVSLAATALTGAYPVLLALRAAAGVAGALVFVAGGVIASRMAAATRSAAPAAIYFSGPGLGIAVSGAAIPPALGNAAGRWPLAWAALAAGAGLATIISWSAARGRDGESRPAGAAAATAAGARRLWPIVGAYLLFGAGYIAYVTFLSAYLVAKSAGVGQIALTWTLLGLAAIAAPAVWSRPIASWRGGRAIATLLALIGAAAALALISSAPAAVMASAVIYGATFLSVPAALTAHIRASVAPVGWTGVLAVFTVMFGIGQMAGPSLAGALADRYGAGATLAWTAVLCIAAAGLAAVVRANPATPATAGKDGQR